MATDTKSSASNKADKADAEVAKAAPAKAPSAQTKAAPKPAQKGTKRQAMVKETTKRKTVKQKQKNTDRRPVTPPATKPFTEDIMTTAKTQMEKMMQDAGSVNKEGWDTFMKAGNRFMKGMEEIMQLSMTQAQKTAEKNSKTMKELMACKTVNEFTEAQTKAAQDNFDEFMKSMTKISELSVKVASDCLEPVNDQFSKTVKKATQAANANAA